MNRYQHYLRIARRSKRYDLKRSKSFSQICDQLLNKQAFTEDRYPIAKNIFLLSNLQKISAVLHKPKRFQELLECQCGHHCVELRTFHVPGYLMPGKKTVDRSGNIFYSRHTKLKGCCSCQYNPSLDDDLDGDDSFPPCSSCDGHQACGDFGCAYALDLGHLVRHDDLPF